MANAVRDQRGQYVWLVQVRHKHTHTHTRSYRSTYHFQKAVAYFISASLRSGLLLVLRNTHETGFLAFFYPIARRSLPPSPLKTKLTPFPSF